MKPTSLVFLILLAASLSAIQPAYADSVALDFSPPDTEQSDRTPDRADEVSQRASEAPRSDAPRSDALSFSPQTVREPPKIQPVARRSTDPTESPAQSPASADLFVGGSDSLVARTVGHAEGTRGADGSKTSAYHGHRDPGNGVWNLGSFSFQHCREAQYQCRTPEEADVHQLRRLQGQAQALQARSRTTGVEMTLEEQLNGIDLANQAPLAALGSPGYVERLKQAHQLGLRGSDAVLWARVRSYWNPEQNRWDAPGLGNTEAGITHDQARRQQAIDHAMRHRTSIARRDERAQRNQVAEQIIFQDLPKQN
ncbi:hypothetical protein H6F43_12335 [Leptolyngbya sp. FACHB-36]|uniref:hypothetical protein n=1 Tax=Leptolyngbya sp. FACHB-36 TaxID=2692808 RepID=UPI001681C119|nr:hypothetical protein [Leptolyngbya sp. FACHB-36]MBD2020967.1 hypothetical protein [Leptolyngbya sp. FACHB-36]